MFNKIYVNKYQFCKYFGNEKNNLDTFAQVMKVTNYM